MECKIGFFAGAEATGAKAQTARANSLFWGLIFLNSCSRFSRQTGEKVWKSKKEERLQ